MKKSTSTAEEADEESELNGDEHEWEEDAPYEYEKISSSRKLLQSTPNDENVLLQFKQAIIEDPGGVLRGWNVTANADYCQWRGVTCDQQTNRVTELNITGTHS